MMKQDATLKIAIAAQKAVLRFLETLDAERIEQWEAGKIKLSIGLTKNSQSVNASSSEAVISPQEMQMTLVNCSTRADAEAFLSSREFSRKELVDTLKALDVPAGKQDNIERLKDKLLENTIGYKLRSQAIQGTS